MSLTRHQETILRTLEDPDLLAQAVGALSPALASLTIHQARRFRTRTPIPAQAVRLATTRKNTPGAAYFLIRNCSSLDLLKEMVKKERRGTVLPAFASNVLCDLELVCTALSRSPASYGGNEVKSASLRRVQELFSEMPLVDINPALEQLQVSTYAFAVLALPALETLFRREDIDFDTLVDLALRTPAVQGLQLPIFRRPEITDQKQIKKVESFLLTAQEKLDWSYLESETSAIIANLPFIFKPEFKTIRDLILKGTNSNSLRVLLENPSCPPSFGRDLIPTASSWLIEGLALTRTLPPQAFEDVKMGVTPNAFAYYLEYRLKEAPEDITSALLMLDSVGNSGTFRETVDALLFL